MSDNKVDDLKEDLEQEWQEHLEELKELDDLPDVDVMIVLEDGVIQDVYATMYDTRIAIIDKAYTIDPYNVEVAKDIKDYETLLNKLKEEESETEEVTEN